VWVTLGRLLFVCDVYLSYSTPTMLLLRNESRAFFFEKLGMLE